MQICSLLPSATEILYALGLGDSVAGVAQTCWTMLPKAASLQPLGSIRRNSEERSDDTLDVRL